MFLCNGSDSLQCKSLSSNIVSCAFPCPVRQLWEFILCYMLYSGFSLVSLSILASGAVCLLLTSYVISLLVCHCLPWQRLHGLSHVDIRSFSPPNRKMLDTGTSSVTLSDSERYESPYDTVVVWTVLTARSTGKGSVSAPASIYESAEFVALADTRIPVGSS